MFAFNIPFKLSTSAFCSAEVPFTRLGKLAGLQECPGTITVMVH